MTDIYADADRMHFRTSDADNVQPDEIETVRNDNGVSARYGRQMLKTQTDAGTAVEDQGGGKTAKRSEVREEDDSFAHNTAGTDPVFYGWSVQIGQNTPNPKPDEHGHAPTLILGQFHNVPTAADPAPHPSLVFELDEEGDFVAVFNDDVGSRSYELVDGGASGEAAKGVWIDVIMEADWANDGTGAVNIWVRTDPAAPYTQVVADTGQNLITDETYAKFGVYASHTERDPDWADETMTAYYDGMRRGDSFAEVDVIPGEEGIGTEYADTLLGDDADNLMNGRDGDDLIRGLDGDDTLLGGEGNDTLRGNADHDQLDGGHGDDWLFGGVGNDLLVGGHGVDRLRGGTGDDTLEGAGHEDNLRGGAGDDLLDGGDGADWLHGEDGNDTLLGGQAQDTLRGGAGDDVLEGGENADRLRGDSGHDQLDGGSGSDTLRGGSGEDTLDGGEGNDLLRGDDGDDLLRGADGDESLHGQQGKDTL
ncbi:MAG: heparin lyase I family protein, partial [Pseudomonadota bacterium]